MKIGILTMYYGNISHGGLLQAYALQKTVEEFGHEAKVISYDYNYIKRSCFRKIAHKIKKLPYYSLCLLHGDCTYRKYEEYMRFIPHSKYYTPETIADVVNEYDIFIVGSDQVWNESYCDDSFYLPFVKEEQRKIAYAASAGKDNLSEKKLMELVDKISTFSAISVREKNLQKELCNHMKKTIDFVCDPTLLCGKTFWENHTSETIIKDRYILLYTLSPNRKIIETISEYAKAVGLPLVTVPNVNCNMNYEMTNLGDIQVWSIGPKEFLRLIKDAEIIITDSFHCSVFSVIFNKEFYCFSRENAGASMNCRLITLLNHLGIDNRFVPIEFMANSHESQCRINYQEVNQRIEEFRNYSLGWLRHIISKYEVEEE